MTSDHTVAFTWHELPATQSFLMFEPPPFELAACMLFPQTTSLFTFTVLVGGAFGFGTQATTRASEMFTKGGTKVRNN